MFEGASPLCPIKTQYYQIILLDIKKMVSYHYYVHLPYTNILVISYVFKSYLIIILVEIIVYIQYFIRLFVFYFLIFFI